MKNSTYLIAVIVGLVVVAGLSSAVAAPLSLNELKRGQKIACDDYGVKYRAYWNIASQFKHVRGRYLRAGCNLKKNRFRDICHSKRAKMSALKPRLAPAYRAFQSAERRCGRWNRRVTVTYYQRTRRQQRQDQSIRAMENAIRGLRFGTTRRQRPGYSQPNMSRSSKRCGGRCTGVRRLRDGSISRQHCVKIRATKYQCRWYVQGRRRTSDHVAPLERERR